MVRVHQDPPPWGRSSVGRAPALHAGGQEFESPRLHHYVDFFILYSSHLCKDSLARDGILLFSRKDLLIYFDTGIRQAI